VTRWQDYLYLRHEGIQDNPSDSVSLVFPCNCPELIWDLNNKNLFTGKCQNTKSSIFQKYVRFDQTHFDSCF